MTVAELPRRASAPASRPPDFTARARAAWKAVIEAMAEAEEELELTVPRWADSGGPRHHSASWVPRPRTAVRGVGRSLPLVSAAIAARCWSPDGWHWVPGSRSVAREEEA